MSELRFDPIHFDLVVCLNFVIGLTTLTVGEVRYLTAAINKRPVGPIIKKFFHLFFAAIAVLFIVTYMPNLVLFLYPGCSFESIS